MLKAKNIVKNFGALPVLKGVSLEIKKGEVVAIIGKSGSGKSTFLRCLNNLEKVDGGSIEIAGKWMVNDGAYAPAKEMRGICLKMGYVFQNFNLFPHMNVLKNLTEAQICVLGRKKEDAEKYARELLGKVGLADKEKAYPCQLSGGQQQRVAIARALALDPDILCFDEPTSALDPLLTQEVLSVIRALSLEKRTMIVVTHEMNFAREVADRVVYMEEGVVVAEGKPDQVFESEAVRAFTGKAEN
ncbi:MAG: amino acid ABC transporter ATP-binding protein [Clostridia bacterium]|nr:amino acid ABC transporter ATP-binding protein [Clostridiales bacterium]MBQ2977308.1 amino acid ABC transporter ATP-binding protein [Clostridia bacterium]